MLEIGYVAITLMGLIMGMVGAGGSILTIPILVYFFKIPIMLASTPSLIMVALMTSIAAIRRFSFPLVMRAIYFIIPSLLGVFLTRYYLRDLLPDTLLGLSVPKILTSMLMTLMVIASLSMLGILSLDKIEIKRKRYTAFAGLILGMIMGLLGVGGSFLIIPALVVFLRYEFKDSIETSFLIVFCNSLTGVTGDWLRGALTSPYWTTHYNLIGGLIGLSILGLVCGMYVQDKIPQFILKKMFGWLVLIVVCAMFFREFIYVG